MDSLTVFGRDPISPDKCRSRFRKNLGDSLDLKSWLPSASISTNTSGAKCAFFAKLPREQLDQEGVQASIRALQLETDFFTGDATVVQNARKANQKEIAWPDFTQVDVQETMAATVALVSRVQ